MLDKQVTALTAILKDKDIRKIFQRRILEYHQSGCVRRCWSASGFNKRYKKYFISYTDSFVLG